MKDPLKIAGTVLLSLLSIAVLISLFSTGELKFDVNSTTHPDAKTISVSGEGTVVVKPDVAKITVSVVTDGREVSEVIKGNTEKMNGIIDHMKKIGIDEKDIQTKSYYLSPQYNYPEDGSPTISGYRLDQDLGITIRDLDTVDDVIDDSTALGANNVYGLTFTLDDDTEVLNEAREKAFDAAKDKASQMAKAAGVKLGDVYSFNEGYNNSAPYYASYAMDARAGGMEKVSTSIEAGSKEYSVTVNMTYEIE